MTQERMKIVLVAGARPNFMKVAPIIREFRKHEDVFDWRLVHTGQHYDHGMSDVFFEELGIPQPHFHMGAGGGSHAEQTARIMIEFERYCAEEKPALVMVVGDVNSTLACSIVAKKQGCRVAHVEAGLRSGDMSMPEEINRIVTDSISDLFFVTEPSGQSNLLKEGHSERDIFFIGHVMIDNLFFQLRRLNEEGAKSLETDSLKKRYERYGVVTMHRPANVDHYPTLKGIVDALNEISQTLPLIFPIHPRTAANLEKFSLKTSDRIERLSPLPYMEFLNLWKDALIVLTDSGGLQEETTALGIPCITMRSNTERPVTVLEGSNIIAGTNPQEILRLTLETIHSPPTQKRRIPEFWDGNAASRMMTVLIPAGGQN